VAHPADTPLIRSPRSAAWLLIGCSALLVGSLSVCLLCVTVLRLTNGEPLVSLLARFQPPGEMIPSTTPTTELLFRDEFRDNRTGWNEFQERAAQVKLEGGKLQLTVVGPDRKVWATAPPTFGDFRLELDSGLLDGPPETRYGLLFRRQDDDNFYQFDIDGLGQYRLGKVVAGRYTPLIEPRLSNRVQAGQALNRLQVVVVGASLTVFVNGSELDTVNDTALREGHIGVFASLQGNGTSHLIFDNLHIYRP
jgi:hypothetical protein